MELRIDRNIPRGGGQPQVQYTKLFRVEFDGGVLQKLPCILMIHCKPGLTWLRVLATTSPKRAFQYTRVISGPFVVE